jgi:hypothetical protein
MVLYYITVATSRDRALFLEQSCKEQGIQLVVLGEDEQWDGFCTKFRVIQKWLNSGACRDTDYVVYSDGYDTYCQMSAVDVQARIHSMPQHKLIISAEYYLWPGDVFHLKPVFQNRAPRGYTRPYPCSGQYCGSVKILKDCLDVALCDAHADDQAALVMYCARYPERVHMDYALKLFHANIFILRDPESAYDMSIEREYILDPDITVSKGSGTFPVIHMKDYRTHACFVHANGAPFVLLQELVNTSAANKTQGTRRSIMIVLLVALVALAALFFYPLPALKPEQRQN